MSTPSVGRIVHYVSYGTRGGEYPSVCRAAIVTEASNDRVGPDVWQLGLCVLNPEGMFFNRGVLYDEGAAVPGSGDCPQADAHGSPFKYCSCGWSQASFKGGTWHWPERVE